MDFNGRVNASGRINNWIKILYRMIIQLILHIWIIKIALFETYEKIQKQMGTMIAEVWTGLQKLIVIL